jgi:YYY domain-containing protein
MPLYPGDWYWMASRTIPGEAITEFPYFTFLYADLHAHLIAMPFVVFSVAWGMSFLFTRGKWSQNRRDNWVGFILSLLLGGLLIGALKPINTWDSYTFLLLNLFIIGYTGWRYMEPAKFVKNPKFGKAITIAGLMLVLVVLSSVLYTPFNRNFHPGYSQLGFWTGDRTPLSSYFTHWGLLLFIVLFWYLWETYQWLAIRPLSALKKLEPHRRLLTVSGIVLLALLIILLLLKVSVAIIVLPLCLWSLILILKTDQSDAKRLAFFMIATALLETLVVELVYLVGDIGRMNVVFKLYMQAWLLLTLALGTGLVALWNDQHKWTVRTQLIFQIPLILLVASALLFPLMGTTDKIHDRIDVNAPKTLDGMQYMQTSSYYDMGVVIPFGEDYAAIRWMQDNIQGSPVIVEGQAYEYRWGNRYTIYTGLPGVVGWNYHQRQQRAILQTSEVQNRVDAVDKFYMTDDLDYVRSFLKKYEVSYIVVGRLEQAFYPGGGLDKFAAQEGILWDEVYRNGETVIYQVRLP